MFREIIKNIVNNDKEIQYNVNRKPIMDANWITSNYGEPSDVVARDGKRYIYFVYIDGMNFGMLKQMGLKPQLHRSRYFFPACLVCRIPVDTPDMSVDARAVMVELVKMARENTRTTIKPNEEFARYVLRYKSAFFEKRNKSK